MEINQFKQLLLQIGTDQGDALLELSKQNIAEFLNINLILISQLSDTAICQRAILMIFIQAKNGSIFESEEIAISFWSAFVQIIPTVFQSPIIPDQSKMMFSSIIAFFAIHFFNYKQDMQIQQYILKLFQDNPSLETYIMNCINDIIMSTDKFGGFSLDVISQFLTANLQFDASFIPKAKLYFSVAMRDQSNEQLVSYFPVLFQSTPENQLDSMISTIGIFAESFSAFFAPHLSTFVPILCDLAKSDREIRITALFCIESFIKGCPNMCHNTKEFYVPVIQCLLLIMSEINENVPLEKDLNDMSPCRIACSVLNTFFKYQIKEKISNHFCALFHETMNNPDLPWPFVHAFVTACSQINFTVIHIITTYEKNSLSFLCRFLPLIQNPATIPHLKIAVYKLIRTLSKYYNNIFQQETFQVLIPIFNENILLEKNAYVQQECAKSLSTFINLISNPNLVGIFLDLYDNICGNLQNYPIKILPYLIKCISPVILRFEDNFFPKHMNALFEAYAKTNDIGIKIVIISTFANQINRVIPQFSNLGKEYQELILNRATVFFSDALLIKMQDNNISINKSILRLLPLLGETSLPFIQEYGLIGKSLIDASKDIQIITYNQFETIPDVSMLVKINTSEDGTKTYALSSDIEDVNNALEMLKITTFTMNLNTRMFLPKLIEIIQHWISYDCQISSVIHFSWDILFSLVFQFRVQPEFCMLINILFDMAIKFIHKSKMEFFQSNLNQFELVFSDKIFYEHVSPEKIMQFIVKLTEYAEEVIQLSARILNDLVQWDAVDDVFDEEKVGIDVAQCITTLDSISMLIKVIMKVCPEIIIPFFQNGYLQKLSGYLQKKESLIYAMNLLTFFSNTVKNPMLSSQVVGILFAYATKKIHQYSTEAFCLLASVFKHIKLPNETSLFVIQQFHKFIEEENDPEDLGFSDLAIGAYAVFILHNFEIIEDCHIDFWCSALPIFEENKLAPNVFKLLLHFFEIQHPTIIKTENFVRLIQFVIDNIDDSGMMTLETRNRFINIFREINSNPGNQEFIRVLMNGRIERWVEIIQTK